MIVQDSWILGQCISHSCTILTPGTGNLTLFQLPIGKKVLVPFLCIYWFCNIFICSDLLASTRKSKHFIIILADNSTSKTSKHLQHTFRTLASPFQQSICPAARRTHHFTSLQPWVQGGWVMLKWIIWHGSINARRNSLPGSLGASV